MHRRTAWGLRLFSCLAIASICSLGAFNGSHLTAADKPALKAGDRIVFLGDSITQGGAGPNGYVTLVRKALDARLPDAKVEVIGAGISGNRVPDLEKRLERDVLSKKPTLVVIYIGINDVWHSQNGRGTSKDDYEQGLKRIIGAIRGVGARVILCTPSVIGEKNDGSNPLDKMLDEYCGISRGVAESSQSQLLDLRKAFVEHLKQHNSNNAERNILTTDGVHLNEDGNKFVANQVLTALGAADGNAAAADSKAAAADSKAAAVDNKAAAGGRQRLLRHVVLFKFKADVTEAQIKEVVDAFAALPKKIDVIHSFEWGTDVSVENKSEGLTHGFLVTFRDEKGRDAYLPHPAHQEFVKLVGPRLEKVVVFDYWTNQ